MLQSARFTPAGSVRSFSYNLLWGCGNVLQKGANACVYLAVGLLQQHDLRTAARIRWGEFGIRINDIDAGLTRWERRTYRELLRPTDRVLLVGCGTGRDLLALGEMGCDVTGLEQVPELVQIAREHMSLRGVSARFVVGSVERADLGGPYDAVVFSLGVYSCLPHKISRVATLNRLRSHLSENGRILISYTGTARQSVLAPALMRLSARLARADWNPELGDNFARDHLVGHVPRYEHLFQPGEVAQECSAAGLRLVRDEIADFSLCCAVAVAATPVLASRNEITADRIADSRQLR